MPPLNGPAIFDTPRLTHQQCKLRPIDNFLRTLLFQLRNPLSFFSRAFLSFSTPSSLEKQRWTSLLAYTGTVNTFLRSRNRRNPSRVMESVDKFPAKARIRKVF